MSECHDSDSDTEGDTVEWSAGPIGDDLVTLSSLPKSRWHTLAHIDTIKVLPGHTMCVRVRACVCAHACVCMHVCVHAHACLYIHSLQ